MRRVLILYAHPDQSRSLANTLLANTARSIPDITFVDLYAEYPRFKIDIDREQQRLLAHDAIVFQFPVYWYSTPALLKEWQDLVLEHGFAYGPDGDNLAGKLCVLAVTAGGPEQAYEETGANRFKLRTLFSPLEQTANLCGMTFLPPLALFSSLEARNDGRIDYHARAYRDLLIALRDERLDIPATRSLELISDTNMPVTQEA